MVKNLPAMREPWIRSQGREGTLEKRMATHSSILAWRIDKVQSLIFNFSEQTKLIDSIDSIMSIIWEFVCILIIFIIISCM